TDALGDGLEPRVRLAEVARGVVGQAQSFRVDLEAAPGVGLEVLALHPELGQPNGVLLDRAGRAVELRLTDTEILGGPRDGLGALAHSLGRDPRDTFGLVPFGPNRVRASVEPTPLRHALFQTAAQRHQALLAGPDALLRLRLVGLVPREL